MNIKSRLYIRLTIGLIITVFVIRFLSNSETVDKSSLDQLNVKLATEIKTFKGSTYNYVYKFWVANYPAEFVIDANDLLSNNKRLDEHLKKEDSITIFIKKSDLEKLTKESKRVRVYQIMKGGVEHLKK